jgi:hypothetical protein
MRDPLPKQVHANRCFPRTSVTRRFGQKNDKYCPKIAQKLRPTNFFKNCRRNLVEKIVVILTKSGENLSIIR